MNFYIFKIILEIFLSIGQMPLSLIYQQADKDQQHTVG